MDNLQACIFESPWAGFEITTGSLGILFPLHAFQE